LDKTNQQTARVTAISIGVSTNVAVVAIGRESANGTLLSTSALVTTVLDESIEVISIVLVFASLSSRF
jgi:hypothetical protein